MPLAQPSLLDFFAKQRQANPYNEEGRRGGPLPPLPPLHVSTFSPFSTSGAVTGRFFIEIEAFGLFLG
jgi:hypothetical protein